MNTVGVRLTRHAQMRRKQMGITEHRIEAVLSDPETIYPGGSKVHPHGRTCYQQGDLVVIIEDRTQEIVTILFHRKEGR